MSRLQEGDLAQEWVGFLGVAVITVATVSFQAIRVARMNPVQSLRSE